jgi:exodeoxyribonuclease VIII
MQEGIHDMPDEIYHSSDGVSVSQLKHMAVSPAHYQHNLNNPMEATPAMQFGTLFHKMNLEPDTFSLRVAVAPVCDRRNKAGKEAWEAFVNSSIGKFQVTESDYNLAKEMTESISQYSKATELLSCDGMNEKAIFSHDIDTGLLKRGKLDRIIEGVGIVDLKTTTDASPSFIKSVINKDYHMQAAYYLDLCKEQDIEAPSFFFLAVEKTAPYGVGVYELDPDLIDIGRRKYKELLYKLAECKERNKWSGYADETVLLRTPKWME